MKNEIRANYRQKFVLPHSLEEWVGKGHPARFIREFVEALNLDKYGFKRRKREEGRPNYSPELLLKIWLYGYFEKIYSSRKLEKACKNQLPLIWLTTMNYPDHNTLWRFFRNNRGAIKEVYKASVRVAVGNDMVGLVLQAVDGTKIRADANIKKSIRKKSLKKLLKNLDEIVEEVFREIYETEEKEKDKGGYALPKKLQDRDELKKTIKEELEQINKSNKNPKKQNIESKKKKEFKQERSKKKTSKKRNREMKKLSLKREVKKKVKKKLEKLKEADTNNLHMVDKDARIMRLGPLHRFCYNAQVVVDEKEQIIVGAGVTMEETDNHQLTNMLERMKENTGEKAEKTLADTGYFSGEKLEEAEKKGYNVLVNVPASIGKRRGNIDESLSKNKFKYNEKGDYYVCPKTGNKLLFSRIAIRKDKQHYRERKHREYVCKSYKDCKYRDICNYSSRQGRVIRRVPGEGSIMKQVEKLKNEKNQEQLKRRKMIVEPVFGWIKNNNHVRRWLFRGLKSVDAQWNLVCTAVNLRKLYKKWLDKPLVYN
ncbi:IS1182 family transposase [Candidatus Pacearchaeota archaeon]|nr:IS1182 family transposase [Candidatus Pacearchaeota archaeon]